MYCVSPVNQYNVTVWAAHLRGYHTRPTVGSPGDGGGGGGGSGGGGGGGGATWFQLCPDVCVEKWRTWVPFQPQGSEMSATISLKTGVKFAASLNMGDNLSWVLYIITYKMSVNNTIPK